MSESPAEIATQLLKARRELLEAVAELSETRVFRPTEREGWTVKHELAYLAAADRVLLSVIDELRQVPGDEPLVLATHPAALRRLHGEHMHVTHELRLTPLREDLQALGDDTARALEQHAAQLDRPVALGGAPAPALDHARAHLARAIEGVQRIRESLG